jgi:hypothetical protein
MTDGGAINAQYDRWEIKAPRCHDQCHDKECCDQTRNGRSKQTSSLLKFYNNLMFIISTCTCFNEIANSGFNIVITL